MKIKLIALVYHASRHKFPTKNKFYRNRAEAFQGIPDAMKARKDVKIARYELKKVEQNVLFKTVKAFTDVIRAEKNIIITQDNLNLSEQQVELDKGRYERGAIKLSDLAQSRVFFSFS